MDKTVNRTVSALQERAKTKQKTNKTKKHNGGTTDLRALMG